MTATASSDIFLTANFKLVHGMNFPESGAGGVSRGNGSILFTGDMTCVEEELARDTNGSLVSNKF